MSWASDKREHCAIMGEIGESHKRLNCISLTVNEKKESANKTAYFLARQGVHSTKKFITLLLIGWSPGPTGCLFLGAIIKTQQFNSTTLLYCLFHSKFLFHVSMHLINLFFNKFYLLPIKKLLFLF
eukprot:TRINITY_DN4753_c2_g1_i1.p1 TRINITY_DN4753_c2_g1~~TRINITY_DN4753_c2_g1_i1.p1  ORF type:complete len:126 (-),score=0.40 TRINITY_DN4753_c2_g1_i1:524-901(-)